jgi:inorganic pyrophosphatase
MPVKTKKSGKKGKKSSAVFASDGKTINVVIETPRGCRNKFHFDPKRKQFCLKSVLPAGAAFPYDFGFVPETKAEDGDPLDVLVLMDEAAFPGCVVPARLLGVIEAKQTEKNGKCQRNDRLVAVAEDAHDYRDMRTIRDMNANLLKELEYFFVSYNAMRGKKFELIGARGPRHAMKLLRKGIRAHKRD